MEGVNTDMEETGNNTSDKEEELLIRRRIAVAINRLGVKAMSRMAGIPSGTLEKYVAQTSMPSILKAAKIARAADVTLDEIAFGPSHRRSGPEAFDGDRLEQAIEVIERGLAQAGRSASPSVKAGMVSAAYEILAEADEEVAEGRILRLVKG